MLVVHQHNLSIEQATACVILNLFEREVPAEHALHVKDGEHRIEVAVESEDAVKVYVRCDGVSIDLAHFNLFNAARRINSA